MPDKLLQSATRSNTWGSLPAVMKLLAISADESAAIWLREALRADNATDVHLASETRSAAAMARL
ncbi:MAG: hypothetical protein KDA42_00415, partial [Planctomycetales bacterium]|nr:hypothetical protein [Planctomycetales bacterium]